MFKRLMYTVLTFLVLYSAAIILYRINEPENNTAVVSAFSSSVTLDYDTLSAYTKNSGASATHYYFFCSFENADCLYVENTILKDAAAASHLNLDQLIEFVDVAPLEDDLDINRLKADWGISRYPAFVAVRNENGEIHIENTLEWNPERPFSADQLTAWLATNGLTTADNTAEADAP